ncbi:hypothetical protein D3C81_92010 [compost metagenome]
MGFEFCSLGVSPGGTAFARPTKSYHCTARSATEGCAVFAKYVLRNIRIYPTLPPSSVILTTLNTLSGN